MASQRRQYPRKIVRERRKSCCCCCWVLLVWSSARMVSSSFCIGCGRAAAAVGVVRRKNKGVNKMALLPVSSDGLSELLPAINNRLPTPEQYGFFWGRTSREKYNALFEAASIAFLGVFSAYFVSFVVGDFIAAILATVAACWFLLGPELKAYLRNIQLTQPTQPHDQQQQQLYGAYYVGHIHSLSVVESLDSTVEYPITDFEDYTMESDEMDLWHGEPYKLRFTVMDSKHRTLQLHTRMSEEYIQLQVGMAVCTVLLSPSSQFTTLAAFTEFYVPSIPCYVGDYPYLIRSYFEEEIRNGPIQQILTKEGIAPWQQQRHHQDSDGDGDNDDDYDEYWIENE